MFFIKQVVVTPFTSQRAWLPIDLLYILNASANLRLDGFYITIFSLKLLQWNPPTQSSKLLALTKPREECHTIHIQHEWEIVASNKEKWGEIRWHQGGFCNQTEGTGCFFCFYYVWLLGRQSLQKVHGLQMDYYGHDHVWSPNQWIPYWA